MKRVKLGRGNDDNAEHMKKTEYKKEDKERGGLKKQRIRQRQRRRRNMKIKM